jgi:hypothetical protein
VDGRRRPRELRGLSDAFGALARTVDPDDPWAHPEAERLDRLSLGDWLRERGATRNVVR